MTTISLEDFVRSIGLEGDARVEEAFNEAMQALPLAALRAHTKKTQAQIAEGLGVSQVAVSKFEGRGDFLLSTLFKYVSALNGRVDLSVQLDDTAYGFVPEDNEGQMCFRLMQRHISKVHTTSLVNTIRQLNEATEERDRDREQAPAWREPQRSLYTRAPSFTFDLAANDEAQPIAA